jgi:hypothetical protein
MIADGYTRLSTTTGPSFIATLTNADVVLLALALFTLGFALAAFLARYWLADLSFLLLVAAGILVAWPAMIALSMAAMLVAVIVSFAHKALMPEQAAKVEAESSAMSNAVLRQLADEPGLRGDARRLLQERAGDPPAGRRADP